MAERSEAQTIGPRRLEGQACGNRLGRGRGRDGKRRGSHGGQVLRERGQGEEHREKAGDRKSQAEHKMRREILLEGKICVSECARLAWNGKGVHGNVQVEICAQVPSCSHRLHVEVCTPPVHVQPSCMSQHAFCMCGSRRLSSCTWLCVPSPCTCVGPWEDMPPPVCVYVCVRARVHARARAPVRK